MDKVCKVLKLGKVVCSTCCSQSVHDEVEGLSQPGKGVLNALLCALQVVDALMGGAVAGIVNGESPVLEEAAPLYEGVVVWVAGVDKCPEPSGEGFDQQVIIVTGGSIERG